MHSLWLELADAVFPLLDIQEFLNEKSILLGADASNLINFLLIKTKHYIYACKYQENIPTINGLRRSIKKEYDIKKYIAHGDKNKKLKFNKRWNQLNELLQAW